MISANYFDGASARMYTVGLTLKDGIISLAGDNVAATYPLSQAHMAEPFSQAPCVLDFADGARCEVGDAGGKAAIAAALGYRKSRVVRLQHHWYGALLALVLLVASVGAIVQWGVPALGERIVVVLPVTVDQRVGDEALRGMRKAGLFQPTRLSDERLAQVQEIFNAIRPKDARIPLTLRLVAMNSAPPNAFALPNGTVLLTDQMILHILNEESELDDEMKAAIAGILAHEIGHVEGRHSMRAIVRSSMLAVGSAALFGDFSTVVAGAPVLIMNMDYSRQMETAADQYAITLMNQARLSTAPLADLFDSLERMATGEEKLPRWMRPEFSYLSSHPTNEERTARFRAGHQADN